MCTSKIDVVIVLDSSGSLGTRGWAATKAAAEMLVQAFSIADARIAVQQYSGPMSGAGWPRYQKARQCANNPSGLDPESDCGIEWLTHFTNDNNVALQAVRGANWMRSYTITSLAIEQANSELMGSRSDTQSIVIIVTDGRPLNAIRTGYAAARIKEKARLMFVPVGKYVPLASIKKWASSPTKENVISVPDWDTLEMPTTVSNLISDMCPRLRR